MTDEDFDYLLDHDPTGLLNEINRLEAERDALAEALRQARDFIAFKMKPLYINEMGINEREVVLDRCNNALAQLDRKD